MEKAYDIKDLGLKLKGKGLDVAEEAAGVVFEAVADWVIESAQLSENKIDDLVAPILGAVKPYVLSQIDKIDGQPG
ncbi:MAG: hypothetical protein KDD45_07745 [Bdellovibrionales bacterium]|nr:hypothetical protein [Bdellovibrionales bacterium]